MADVLIQPLDLADFDPSQVPTDPGFTQLLNNELGIQATDLDGFNLVFDEAVAIVDALGGALEGLGFALVDAFGEADTIDEAPLGEHLTALTGQLAAGAAIVASTDALLGTAAPPPTGAGPCDADVVLPTQTQSSSAGAVASFPIQIADTLSVPLTISAVSFSRNDSSVFSEDAATPRTLQPGDVYTFQVTVKLAAVGTFHGILAAQGDDQADAHTLCITVTVQAAGAPPPPPPPPNPTPICIPVRRA